MTASVSSIDTFNHYFHQPSLHPMVAVGDLSRADDALYAEQDFGMYCVILMDAVFGELRKNGQPIQYQSGSIFSLKPGQRAALRRDYTVKPRGWMLAFRPELLVKSGLGRDFYMFDFFNHEVSSALALSEQGQPPVGWCADQFNLTANYFGSLVKREMHISAQEFIQGKIIQAAQKLLESTTMSVGAIAEELGFAYANHFTRLFTGKTGMSPLQYRNSRISGSASDARKQTR